MYKNIILSKTFFFTFSPSLASELSISMQAILLHGLVNIDRDNLSKSVSIIFIYYGTIDFGNFDLNVNVKSWHC